MNTGCVKPARMTPKLPVLPILGCAVLLSLAPLAAGQDGQAATGGAETTAGDASRTGASPADGGQQDQPRTDAAFEARVQALINGLDAEEYALRKMATQQLAAIEGFDRRALARVLTEQDLSAEQRERLEGIALTMFEREPRAGLGVQFDVTRDGFGAGIARTVEGFDAARVLRPGDVVISADGAPIRSPSDLRYSIISRAPGEKLPLVIQRGEETMEVEPELGAFSELGNAAPLSTRDLLIAWRMWFDRLGFLDAPGDVIFVNADTTSNWAGRPPSPSRATAGGSVRDGTSYAGVRTRSIPNVRVFQNGVEIQPGGQIRGGERLRAELIRDRIAFTSLQIDMQRMMLDAVGNAGPRAEIEQEIARLEQELARWQRQLEAEVP